MTKPQRKNLKKLAKHITYFQTIKEKLIMINSVTQLLREVEVEVDFKALVVLIVHLSQIFLKIFLVTLVEAPQGELVIEEMI